MNSARICYGFCSVLKSIQKSRKNPCSFHALVHTPFERTLNAKSSIFVDQLSFAYRVLTLLRRWGSVVFFCVFWKVPPSLPMEVPPTKMASNWFPELAFLCEFPPFKVLVLLNFPFKFPFKFVF